MARIRSGRGIIGLAIASVLGAPSVFAVTKDWTKATVNADGTYSYNKTTNWSPAGVPAAADIARFNKGSAYTVSFTGAPKVSRIIVGKDNLIMDFKGGSLTATATAQASLTMGVKANDVARLQIRNGSLITSQSILGSAASSSGSVTVSTGGVWNGLGSLTLGSLGLGNLTVTNGGVVNATWLKLGTVAGAKGTALVSGAGSQLNISGNTTVGTNASAGSSVTGVGSLFIRSGAKTNINGILDIRKGGDVRVEGGTLTVRSIQNISGGKLSFTAGVINIQQSDFLVGNLGPLGSTVTLTSSQVINVTQNTLLNANAVLIMQDGKLNTSMIDNFGEIRFNGLNSLLSASLIENHGLIRGRGKTAADINNTGEIRSVGSDNLTFNGSVSSAGQINLISGGAITFAKRLFNSGLVAVAGVLGVPAGITNTGAVNFTTGVSSVAGALHNNGEGTVSVAGTSTQFLDDVGHNGEAFFVAPSSVAFFSGRVFGDGDFSGGGLLSFLSTSDYSPGNDNQPALVRMANHLLFQSGATLTLDLGANESHDQLLDEGDIQLAEVRILIDPAFAPQPGKVYNLVTANNITYAGPITVGGTPPLPYQWIQTPTELSISFIPEPSIAAGICLASALFLGRRRRTIPV